MKMRTYAINQSLLRVCLFGLVVQTAVGFGAAAQSSSSSSAATAMANPPGYSTARTGTIHDFEYFVGGWTTRQRRLKARGVGSNEWEEFPGHLCMSLYLNGMATVDELYFPTKGSAGLTLRTFDPEKRQ